MLQATPEAGDGDDVTVLELLDRAQHWIDEDLVDEPIVAASVHLTLSQVYSSLDRFDDAERHVRRALELRRENMGPQHASLLTCFGTLADLQYEKGQYEDAKKTIRDALSFPDDALSASRSDVWSLRGLLSVVLLSHGDPAEAEAVTRKNYEEALVELGEDDRTTLSSLSNLGFLQLRRAHYEEAHAVFRQVHDARLRLLGEDSSSYRKSLHNLVSVLSRLGRYEEAERRGRHLLSLRRKLHGDRPHTEVANSLNAVANIVRAAGKLDEAAPLYEEALAVRRQLLPPGHTSIASSCMNLASLLKTMGRFDAAEKLLAEALSIEESAPGPPTPRYFKVRYELAELESFEGDLDAALERATDLVEALRAVLGGEDHRQLLRALFLVTKIRLLRRDAEAAVIASRQVVESADRLFADKRHATRAAAHFVCGGALGRNGRFEEARKEFALGRSLLSDPPTNLSQAASFTLREAEIAVLAGDRGPAAKLLREVLDAFEQHAPLYMDQPALAERLLADLHLADGKLDDAEKLYRRALDSVRPAKIFRSKLVERDILQGLIRLANEREDEDAAARWRAESDALDNDSGGESAEEG